MSQPDRALRAALVRRPTFPGLAVGLLFWWQSLYPTLMPRTWVTQAAMSAICTAIGIAVGTLLGDVAKAGLRAAHRPVAPAVVRGAFRAATAVGVAAIVLGGFVWPRWQTDQRRGVSLGPLPAVQAIPMLLLTAVLLVVLVVIGRLVGRGVRRIHRALGARQRARRLRAAPRPAPPVACRLPRWHLVWRGARERRADLAPRRRIDLRRPLADR